MFLSTSVPNRVSGNSCLGLCKAARRKHSVFPMAAEGSSSLISSQIFLRDILQCCVYCPYSYHESLSQNEQLLNIVAAVINASCLHLTAFFCASILGVCLFFLWSESVSEWYFSDVSDIAAVIIRIRQGAHQQVGTVYWMAIVCKNFTNSFP